MDFFKKIFEKKVCSICGKESGLLGNRKLEDGNLCKECTDKLSPWYEERRHATVSDIQAHLKCREANRKALESFSPSKSIGENYVIHFAYDNGVASHFVVSKEKDYVEENADIFFMLNVKYWRLDVKEHRTELTKLDDNKQRVSYEPPRFEYRYDFNVIIEFNNLNYCDDIKFKLNKHSVKVEVEQRNNRIIDPTMDYEYRRFKEMYDEIDVLLESGRRAASERYAKVMEEVAEQKKKINELNARALANQAQKEQEEQEVSGGPKFCPNCGTPATGSKFCPECGQPMKV